MPSATQADIAARLATLSPAQRRNYDIATGAASAPATTWTHPAYAGTDAAYAAWLAGANLQGTSAVTEAKRRRAQLDESYRQALSDLELQSVGGRRNIQSNMLQRGIFRSGETDRRKQEYDALIAQGRDRAGGTLVDQQAQVDASLSDTLGNLGMQGAAQVSQAMLRDSLAAYNAAQAAATPTASIAAPQQQAAAYQQQAPAPAPGATPSYIRPTTNQAALDPRYRVTPPKPASGATGQLRQTRTGGLQ